MTLTLGFPGADAARTKEVCFSPAQVSHTATAAGHRVLLIEPQGVARVQAHRLMQDAGMSVDAVASIDQARRGLHDGAADVIVTGVPVDDTQWAALLDELRAAQPRLRVVELVDDDDAFAFSVPDADRPARVGRHEMARTLLRAVSQELDAAWAE
jgi:CheY-like chemotaxis protein